MASGKKHERNTPALTHLGLDEIDLDLIIALQKYGRRKRNELAEEIGLSLPAASERLRKLEEERGIITGYHAKVDPKRIGLDVAAFIFVTVESSTLYPSFLEAASKHPEILEVHAITGDGSHLLKIRTWNTSTLEQLLSEIQSWKGVKQTRTNIVLSSPKESTALPVEELKTTHK
ncbi:MAG TPA: Lrp/AsnC family transcriptional regulator [Candidatus Kapabacteria bacterium]|nr:Lrp/AsnC family transcriptional regulator [Candidatus Kapabacteria bacterium]